MIKTTKTPEQANAITHGGVFHADEVLATVILSKAIDNLCVCRTFKMPEELREEVIVYDIGFGKFDHHQKGGNGTRKNGVPYASCGLIWKEFGHKVVENTCNPELIWKLIDRDLIQGIDASDNGAIPKLDYPAYNMSLSQTIAVFNPTWDSDEDDDDAFIKAVKFAEVIFDNVFKKAVSKARGKDIVEEAIDVSEDHVLVLKDFAPWREFVLSSTNEKAKEILFVVFPSIREGYNWQCVPKKLGSKENRKNVPSEWRGLNGQELQKVSGVETAIFCHSAGFIGGAETFEDTLKMAKMAVNYKKEIK